MLYGILMRMSSEYNVDGMKMDLYMCVFYVMYNSKFISLIDPYSLHLRLNEIQEHDLAIIRTRLKTNNSS